MKKIFIALLCITIIAAGLTACSSPALNTQENAVSLDGNVESETPVPEPTRTPRPTEAVIEGYGGPDGWKVLSADDVLIYVPDSYIGSKTNNADSGMGESIAAINEMLSFAAVDNQEIDMEIRLWGVDNANTDLHTMAVVMGCDNSSIDSNLEAIGKTLGILMLTMDGWDVEDEMITLDHYQVYQIAVNVPGESRSALYYLLQSDDTFWLVMYATNAKDPTTQIADFKQSINTIYFP